MLKLNQKGFGVVVALLVIAAISLLGFGGYYVYSQNTNTSDDTAKAKETIQSNDSKSMTSLNISRRDTQRKSDIGLLLARSESYAANNNGSYPVGSAVKIEVIDKYIDKDFVDPLLEVEYIIISGLESQLGEIQYELGNSCDENDNFTTESNDRYLAVRTLLENNKFFCQDNT